MNPLGFFLVLITLLLGSTTIIACAVVVAMVKSLHAAREQNSRLLDRLLAVTNPAAHTADQAAAREMLRVIQAPHTETTTAFAPERYRNGSAEPFPEEPGGQVGQYQAVQ